MTPLSFLIFFGIIYCQSGISSDEITFSHEEHPYVPYEDIEHAKKQTKEIYNHIIITSHGNLVKSPAAIETRDNCNSFQTCYECVKGMFYRCSWCHTHGCTDIGNKLCPSISKSDNNRAVCPFITHQGPIFIPSGQRSHIAVELHASNPAIYEMDIICQVKFKNRLTHLKGLILTDTVYCYPMKLDVGRNKDLVYGSFRLIWGGVDPFSNELPVTAYNCGTLADDCETCRLLRAEFGCGWCDAIGSCVVANKCDDVTTWSLNKLTCHYKKMFFV